MSASYQQAYNEYMQKLAAERATNPLPAPSSPRLLTSGEQVNLYNSSTTSFGGAIAMIILGVPLLIIPPLGLSLIGMGLASFGLGARAAIKLGADQARRG